MDLMSRSLVLLDVEASSKEEVIRHIANVMEEDGRLIDKTGYVGDVEKREQDSSTAVGYMVATPHAKSVHVKEPSLAFLRLKQPILWDGVEDVQVIFQIAVPSPGQGDKHLENLAMLFRRLVHEEFQEEIKSVRTPEEVMTLLGDV